MHLRLSKDTGSFYPATRYRWGGNLSRSSGKIVQTLFNHLFENFRSSRSIYHCIEFNRSIGRDDPRLPSQNQYSQPNLPFRIYETKPTKPNPRNKTYQTKPTLEVAWHEGKCWQHCRLTIWNNLLSWQTVPEDKFQKTWLILERGALSREVCDLKEDAEQFDYVKAGNVLVCRSFSNAFQQWQ